jgi:thiol-disulfide isomerase/thioredoxin
MNPLSAETWNQGLFYPEYRQTVRRNSEILDEVHQNPIHTEEDLAVLRRLPPLRVLVLGEDWCPDVYHTLPTWARIAEELPGWELRVFPRDSHPDLMWSFLWREEEAKRIPVYAFYDAAGRLQTWWSGRSGTAEAALQELTGGRPYSEFAPEDQKRLGEHFEEGYRRKFRRANFEEILAQLQAFYHLG